MRKMRTHSVEFWREEYEVSPNDLDLVANVILEAGRPLGISALASAVILRRFSREKEAAAQQARKGRVYRPVDTFAVGEELLFANLEMVIGTVQAVRPGQNAKFGEFDVIRVTLDGKDLEFAARFDHPHPLNRPVEELLVGEQVELSDAEMVRLFGHHVADKLEAKLATSEDMVQFNDTWFLSELLPEVHVGYLNLAEAMIYEAGHPLVAREMLADLEMGASGSEEAQLFALNHALGDDARFDNVGTTASPIWYLYALEPKAAAARPAVLEPAFSASGGEYLGLTMLDMIDEIGDELDDVETTVYRQVQQVALELSFPHWYAGTLPATMQFLRLLPISSGRHYPITLVDEATDERFDVWVLPDERYVAGLGEWYKAKGLVLGTQITLTPGEESGVFKIGVSATRGRRSEWVRSVTFEDGTLRLQMQRTTVPVRADRNTLVDVPDADAVAAYMAQRQGGRAPLGTVLRAAFAELAKLSGRGLVHAKSLYSVVNMMRRSGAVPVFAELTRQACFDSVGDGQWLYDEANEGKVYRTPDEMRDRPLSSHEDLIRDQVIQYVGR